MRTLACLTLLTLSTGLMAENAVMAIGYGISHHYDSDTRDVTNTNGYNFFEGDQHLILGFSAPERAFVGYPWFDLEWNRATGEGNRIDTVGITYVERVPIWKFWLGGGVGTAYNDLSINNDRTKDFRFALKAVAGLELFSPLYAEASYFYAGSARGYDLDFFAVDIGLRF